MVLIPNKREFLARRMANLGFVSLLERWGRRPALLVLTYHRIGNPAASPFYGSVFSAGADRLEAELRALSRTHRVVGMDEVIALAENGFRVKEPTALITFDDGYRDNFDLALPVLQRVGVPATFFLSTAFFQRPQLPWWDFIAYVVGQTRVPWLALELPVPMEIDLNAMSRTDAISKVIWAYFDNLGVDDSAFRSELTAKAEVDVDENAIGQTLFMNWEQARSLLAAGMSIGSHAHSHRDLGRMSDAEQRLELADSKRILESELGCTIQSLAYPYGWPGTFNDATLRVAREVDYRVAFASREGINLPGAIDPFAMLRLGIGFADTPALLRARWALYESLGKSFI